MIVTGAEEVWRLPHPSQEFERGPEAQLTDGTLIVRYDFETEGGKYKWASFRFADVSEFEFLGEELCGPEQFEALDKLLEVRDSPWLKKAQQSRKFRPGQLHHYRIYFDDHGCYEVLSATFLAED